ncbi:MAG: UDP-N-acetylmuramoyl-L-alanyl-D-glutamate--2,6-diaminopimelate ligase [Sulfobacillus sp.]
MHLVDLTDLGTLVGDDLVIAGVTHDSRRCQAGDLFVAVGGAHFDGSQFILAAVQSGAAAVVTERAQPQLTVPQLIVPDARAVLPEIARRVYQDPSRQLELIGVTGTNGKSTVAFLVAELLKLIGHPCGLIGTVWVDTGRRRLKEERTTPEVSDVCRYLHEMVGNHLDWAAMEVSSHALALGRVSGLRYRAAIFTNLTRDHLDYHRTMEAYGDAKAKLFESLDSAGLAILNADDPAHEKMARRTQGTVVTYGVSSAAADFRASHVSLAEQGSRFELTGPSLRLAVESPLIGRFNVANLLASLTVLISLGFDPEQLVGVVPQLTAVPGRFERVPGTQPFAVVVDYAHTPDGLEKALAAAREVTRGRVIVVVGCGGDRDAGKRPVMGEMATRQSDLAVLTSDNPRTEDPLGILAEMESGARRGHGPFRVIPDRRQAIAYALGAARAGDIVLIAGKGHEAVQVIGDREMPFDDRLVASELLERP